MARHCTFLAGSSHCGVTMQGVSFEVKSGESVGIVGRTGSGKSSLIVALFRLAEPYQGAIMLDGHNLLELGLQVVPIHLSSICMQRCQCHCQIVPVSGCSRWSEAAPFADAIISQLQLREGVLKQPHQQITELSRGSAGPEPLVKAQLSALLVLQAAPQRLSPLPAH